jgi:hypothetical protein
MVPVPPASAAEAVVQAREATVESAAVKPAGVKSTAVETAAMKPAKPSAMKSATAVEAATATAAVPPAAAPMRCVGEVWLAENGRAQQRSRKAHQTPLLPGPSFVIA